MFTGIVTHQGTIRRITGEADRRLEIEPGFLVDSVAEGASVSHSGVCLTVTDRGPSSYWVDCSAETLARTTIGAWQIGRRLNLERSLKLGDELGGHLVFGHVDAVATVQRIEPVGESWRFAFAAPPDLLPMMAVKGSVGVDGISLTVTETDDAGFSVVVIPHSFAVTTLAQLGVGDHVNVEIDMLARYVARQLATSSRMHVHAG